MAKTKILIVEDDPSVAELVETSLQALGYDVLAVASSGEDAVKKVEKVKPDVVLMDIKLEGILDGIEAAGQISSRYDIPIIYLSGHADEETLERAKITEPFGYLLKPFQQKELYFTIELALHKHRMERKLKESEERYRALYEESPSMSFSVDAEGTILSVNKFGAEQLGYTAKELLGQSVLTIIYREDREDFLHQLTACLHDPAQIAFQEFRKVRKDGNMLWVKGTMSTAQGADGNRFILIISEDITKRKQTEEKLLNYQRQLRSLASRLLLTEEREKHRIATDIHDRISQILAVSKIKLGELRESASSSDLARNLNEVHKLIEQMILDTRSLTFELSPPILHELGLESAMEWLAEQIQTRHKIAIDFEDDGQSKPLVDDAKILLFQIARELLVNIVKHSRAQNARVSIRRNGEYIQINVEDDGVGFDTSKINSNMDKAGGFGLFSIRERLDHFGGYLKIRSEPGKGTCITLMAPLKPDKESTKEKGK